MLNNLKKIHIKTLPKTLHPTYTYFVKIVTIVMTICAILTKRAKRAIKKILIFTIFNTKIFVIIVNGFTFAMSKSKDIII